MTFRLVPIAILLFTSCSTADWSSDTSAMETGKNFPVYGGNKANNRYSPLTQINADNVNDLQVVWMYYANDSTKTTSKREIQCQPIVVDGVLYGTAADLNLFALNAATGEQLWKFEPETQKLHNNRGVMYWEEGDDKRIFYTVGSFLYAVNASTGKLITTFGDNGKADLHEGITGDFGHEIKDLTVTATSPGVIFKNTLIMGSTVSEGGDSLHPCL